MSGPQFTQGVAGQIRQWDEAVLVALAATDMNTMAPGIDITDLQGQRLAQPRQFYEMLLDLRDGVLGERHTAPRGGSLRVSRTTGPRKSSSFPRKLTWQSM